jgi:peptide/nickel transport system ATP-binding protein
MTVTLRVDELSVAFRAGGRSVQAVDRLSFGVRPGEIVALVGESGCGKSATAMAIAGLLPPSARIDGSIRLSDRELYGLPERAMNELRGAQVGTVFQDPLSALNPVLTIGRQVAEPLRRHAGLSRRAADRRVVELLQQVGIADPERRAREYPHQLSGGMCQRVMIAIAIACGPQLFIADEPTTAVDATMQATILELLRALVTQSGMALLIITHDLGVVADIADRVVVMYAGRAVAEAEVHELFEHPRHPYTRALLAATPVPGERNGRLEEIPGIVPTIAEPLERCAFVERCSRARPECHERQPRLLPLEDGQSVACFHPWEAS